MLNLVLSNSVWKGDDLAIEFRQPFDLLASTNLAYRAKKAAGASESEARSAWRGRVDVYRTTLIAPPLDVQMVLKEIRETRAAA